MDIKCEFKELVDIIKLVPNPKNPNKHSDKQIDLLQRLIRHQGWRHPIIVSNRSGFVCAGHGRLLAAIKMGLKQVPVDYQDFDSEAQEYQFMVSDNSIQELSELDEVMIQQDILDFGPDFDLDMLAIPDFKIEPLDKFNILNESVLSNSDQSSKLEYELFSKDQIIEAAFKVFREKGFPYPTLEKFEMMIELNKLKDLELEKSKSTRLGYRIADTFNKHRFHASAIDMNSPFDAFNDNDKLLKALDWQISQTNNLSYKYIGTLSLVNGTQSCSNFRPGFAKYLYNTFSRKGSRVFDSSMGYGGRLVGFMASHCSEYVGTDPNSDTFLANQEMIKTLGVKKKFNIFNEPIEDLDVSQFENKLDFYFTSPPYFKKEIYSQQETQSCHRYPEYNDWKNTFLATMMEKSFKVLKNGSTAIVNIEDVKIKGELFPLVQDTIQIAKEIGFTYLSSELFEMATRTIMVDGEKQTEKSTERVLIFGKN